MTLHEPTWDMARATAAAAASVLPSVSLPIVEALGLTLAEPILAKSKVPAFNTSMMDGWAVAGRGPWTVRGRVLAGSVPPEIHFGDALEIATGAPVPVGATAVLRREWGVFVGNSLTTHSETADGLDIRVAGDEAQVGDVLVPAGDVVTPPVIGLAALVGNDHCVVHRAPSVTALILGDEIVSSGIPPLGKVRDALGVQILQWCRDFAARQHDVVYVRDELAATVAALQSTTADIVFTTGGTARGPVDHMHAALAAVGAEVLVDEVKVRPGHPMLLAQLPTGQFVIGLPGNPLAAFAAFVTFAEPILGAMVGRRPSDSATIRTATAIKAPASDRRLIPAVRQGELATPTEYWGSAMLRGIATANCLLVSAPGGSAAGELVQVLDLPW